MPTAGIGRRFLGNSTREDANVSAKRPQRPFLACLWMIGALVTLSTMAIAGRELSVRVRGRGQANRERTGEVSVRSERGEVRWSAGPELPAALERTGT